MPLTLGNGMLHDAPMDSSGPAEKQNASLNSVQIGDITYFAATDIAAVLKISRQTLWRWRRAGKIPLGHRFRDGQTLFTEGEVEEIKVFALRVEPIETTDRSQLELFKPPRN
jgi:helix-turn-helix protein